MEVLRTLEAHYGDMQDTEFTIEEGKLYLLQTRNAKRPAQAAVRFACDAVDEELLSVAQAIATIDAGGLDALLHPTFDPSADFEVLASGVSASPGAAKGEVVFTAAAAVEAAGDGRDVILVRPFTEADDVAGFHAARGILTSEGGKASHAALVARGMGRPAVVGAGALAIDLEKEHDQRRRHGREGGRPDRDRRHARLRDARGRAARRGAGRRALRARARLGRRAAPAGRARERRRPGERAPRARARRRGDRALPHRAHVHGRRPDAEDARDDHGRRRRRAPRRAERAAAAAAGGLRGPVRGDGRAAGQHPPARPAAARVPARTCRRCAPTSSARGSRRATISTSSSGCSRASRRCTRRTRCSARAAAGWGSSTPRSTRCRCTRSCAPSWRCRSAAPMRRTRRS